jgi:4-hydroxyphenylpyruvate dioxygenase-like putative hemolysin
MITLKNGLIISANNDGFESINHLTGKIDKGSFTKFAELPDIFYKELLEDDRNTLTTIKDESLITILKRTRIY